MESTKVSTAQNRKNKIKEQQAELLKKLDSEDQDIPANPIKGKEDRVEGDSLKIFEQFYNDKIAQQTFEAGQVVRGRIVGTADDYVLVDVNYKSEGLVPKSEFQGADGYVGIEEGSEVEVYVEEVENEKGMMVLSKDRADIIRVWKEISQVAKNQEIIEGTVIAKVKGGLHVDIGGVKAFLPGSHVELRPVNLSQYVGNKYSFKIIKFNQKRGNIVLSRRVILEEKRENLRSQTLGDMDKGSVVTGIVKNITDYGAFLDLGGIDGLLHITDISWSRIKHPSEKITVGESIKVKILKFDREKRRVSLGLKQLHENENPWELVKNSIKKGDVVQGQVTGFTEYGAFVTIKDGIEGLVHISEICWGKKDKLPSEYLKSGSQIDLKVIQVDQDQQRISFSIKRLEENPWQKWTAKYKEGQSVDAEIKSINNFGLVVQIEGNPDLKGVIRQVDLSWSSHAQNKKPRHQIGDVLKAVILNFSLEDEKFYLGVKQLQENPWAQVESLYPIGSVHEVKVVKMVDFGVFVELCQGVEGLIHISELDTKRVNKVEEVVEIGDVLNAEVITMDKDLYKIGLSAKLVKLRGDEPQRGSSKNQEAKPQSGKPQSGKPYDKRESFFAKALKASFYKEDEDPKEASPKEASNEETDSPDKKED